MSLDLSFSYPLLTVSTFSYKTVRVYGHSSERLEQTDFEAEIPINDFCALVDYVFTNTDLSGPDDPRLGLLEKFKNSALVPGFNEKEKRIQL